MALQGLNSKLGPILGSILGAKANPRNVPKLLLHLKLGGEQVAFLAERDLELQVVHYREG